MTDAKCANCGAFNLLATDACRVCGVSVSPVSIPFPFPDLRPKDSPQSDTRRTTSINSIAPSVEVGAILGTTFNLFFRNLWLITKIVFVIVAPFEVFKALSIGEVAQDSQLAGGLYVLDRMCTILIAPALMYALMRVMQTGVAPGVNEAYRWGLSKLWKLAICAVIASVLQGMGLLLCIVPGILIGLAFELVYPLAVLEQGSAAEVLQRSRDLTKGYRWEFFAAQIVLWIAIAAINFCSGGAASLLSLGTTAFWPVYVLAAIVAGRRAPNHYHSFPRHLSKHSAHFGVRRTQ